MKTIHDNGLGFFKTFQTSQKSIKVNSKSCHIYSTHPTLPEKPLEPEKPLQFYIGGASKEVFLVSYNYQEACVKHFCTWTFEILCKNISRMNS